MEKITIEEINSGVRIDKFLVKEFFLYSRGEVIRKIKKGEAKVNGKSVKPSYVLEENDLITLEAFSREPQETGLIPNTEIPLDVMFENEDIIVINKQAGLQVHPSIIEKRQTLVNALVARYPELLAVHDGSQDAEMRPGIVHRLDKETSGVMVIARNLQTLAQLKANFQEREMEKKYLAITHGTFAEKEGVIEKPLAKSSDYRKQVIARANTKTVVRAATTHYKVLEESLEYSLLEVTPKTGRTHQIRIHLASIGHPIVGDTTYGVIKSKKKELRQLLHAQSLRFELFGQNYEFSAPVPQDFTDFWQRVDPS